MAVLRYKASKIAPQSGLAKVPEVIYQKPLALWVCRRYNRLLDTRELCKSNFDEIKVGLSPKNWSICHGIEEELTLTEASGLWPTNQETRPSSFLSSPSVISQPPTPCVIRAWWTSSIGQEADRVATLNRVTTPGCTPGGVQLGHVVVHWGSPWPDRYWFTRVTPISTKTTVTPLSYIP